MIRKIIILFKIARKIAQSDIVNIVSKFHEIPKIIKFSCYILSFSFSKAAIAACCCSSFSDRKAL